MCHNCLILTSWFYFSQARISEAGHDGIAVQEAIQSLPRSNIRHNDFSHLGIPTMEQMDLDDAVSVISATASASIPYAQVRVRAICSLYNIPKRFSHIRILS